jgi:pimeloyl-[acyl-carrier protein] methyl ester esterase
VLDVRTDQVADRDDRGGEVILRDGTPMSYRRTGEGPVVLAVHGWAANSVFFEDLAERLAGEFGVVVPDLRAHGATAAGSLPLGIETLADDLHELVVALDLRDVVLLGWSMGAMVAWSMIARHGTRRLAGLVIEDMTPRVLNDEGWALGISIGLDAAASQRAVSMMQADWAGYAEAFAPRLFARERRTGDPALVADAMAELGRCDGAAMADIWNSMTAQDMRPVLSSINLPVLVAHGALSEVYGPETSRYLVDTLPDARDAEFPRSGHAPHLEQPEEFAQAVTEFARQVQAGTTHQHNIEGSTST